jgi:phosphatidylglycerophosphatase C
VVVVSASLDVYLSEWCEQLGLELIATELESEGGLLTGRYRAGDCNGAEKTRRVRARYALEAFPTVYAYGDTHEDEALRRSRTRETFGGKNDSERRLAGRFPH